MARCKDCRYIAKGFISAYCEKNGIFVREDSCCSKYAEKYEILKTLAKILNTRR